MFDGNLYAAFLGWIAPRTKSVITLHTEGYSQSPPQTIKQRLFVFLEKALLTPTAAKVAVSAAVARDFEAFFGWREVAVVHNGVVAGEIPPPLDDARRAQIRAENGVSHRRIHDRDAIALYSKKRSFGSSRRPRHIEPGKVMASEIGGPWACHPIPRPATRAGGGTWPGRGNRIRAADTARSALFTHAGGRRRSHSFFDENRSASPRRKPCCLASRSCRLASMVSSNW